MFRKILLCDMRMAVRSWTSTLKRESTNKLDRANIRSYKCLANNSVLSGNQECEKNLHIMRETCSKRISSRLQSSFIQPMGLRKDLICENETASKNSHLTDYSALIRNTCSPLTQSLLQSGGDYVILPGGTAPSVRFMATGKSGFSSIRNRISSLHAKKRAPKKKKAATDLEENEETVEGFAPVARHKFLTFDPDFSLPEIQPHRPPQRDWQVIAYATADEYDLDGLLKGLTAQGLYTAAAINPGNSSSENSSHAVASKAPKSSAQHAKHQTSLHPSTSSTSQTSVSSTAVPDAHDVLHMVAAYRVGSENREIYFFREGSVVFWNVAELECSSVLLFLKKYEIGSYKQETIEEESESLSYTYSDLPSKTRLARNRIILNPEGSTDLEKYTFSNALAISVKLGMWEASLEKYIEDIEYVSEELSKTGRVVLQQDQVLQCMGQLFALRHLINLSSDLLDTPDFYWEHEDLEQLYQKTANYLNVSKRTSVMNVKLSHCVELMELLKSHLNEQHSARLEWIIIILIMIEVGFEVLHMLERWF